MKLISLGQISVFQNLFDLARGTYETSRYLFYDNAVNDGKGEKAASGDVEQEGAQ